VDLYDKYYSHHSPVGSSEAQIDAEEARLGVTFPSSLREYYSWLGSDDFGIFQGSDAFLTNIATNSDVVNENLREAELQHFKDGPILSYFSHQGYVCYWFYYSDIHHDDPECFCYVETEDGLKFESVGRLSDWLFEELKSQFDFLYPKNES